MASKAEAAEQVVPVCAIGASAGGVGALKELFRHLPTDLGLAYVVITHLAPDQPSTLDQIVAGVTDMPVLQVQDRATLEPDRVYFIPPDRELVIDGDDVNARPFTEARGQRAPIDMFFRSVASGRGDGLAVILSGSGSDGSVGVRSIKEAGGVIFVQEPKSAEFPMMPRSAIAMGVADFVAPIPRLVERMVEVSKSKEAVRSLPLEPSAQILQRIIGFLRSRTGHDFSAYKRATVMRRVSRRMQVGRCPNLESYLEYLMSNPEEAQELLADLLISVTAFFRDRGAYEALAREVVAPLFEDVQDDGIRVWVAGCATGEEAYSLGILLLEEAARRKVSVPIQIFATDLDEGALATGREGRYPASIEADVSQERLDRFFVREGVHYRVKQQLREIVLFAEHSLLKDPPFMRLNLVSCRNLLIYLERELQRQVCALLAYGLRPLGYLFLGSAETVDASPDLFATVNREARIYQARPQAQRQLPVISRFPAEHRPDPMKGERRQSPGLSERTLHVVHLETLERSAPPSALVDGDFQVLNLSDRAGRFLMPPGGPPTSDITALVRPELRLDVRTAVRRAVGAGETTLIPPLVVSLNGSSHRVGLYVAPGGGEGDGVGGEALVLFLDGGPVEPSSASPSDTAGEEVDRLRNELNAAEARLATSRAEHENAIQDLRVANEELQSINEEYRSTSEELETSKEELQSMNEELQTVNAELKSKLEIIGGAHSDLQNLVAATDVGTLFLDQKLRIRMFTPPLAQLFNVTETDVGRPITDFTHHLAYATLAEDAAGVLRSLTPVEQEIEARSGRWYMMRLRPYRTVDDRIEGVVVTFVDVTEWREATMRLRESEERQGFLLTLSDALRPSAESSEITATATRLIGERLNATHAYYVTWRPGEDYGEVSPDYSAPGAQDPAARYTVDVFRSAYDRLLRGDTWVVRDAASASELQDAERDHYLGAGVVAWVDIPLVKDGVLQAALCVVQSEPRDWRPDEVELIEQVAERCWAAVERSRAEAALRDSEERHRSLFDSVDEGVCLFERLPRRPDGLRDYRYIAMNPAMRAMFGIPDLSGQSVRDSFPGAVEDWYDAYDRVLETGQSVRFERESEPQGMVLEMYVTRLEDGTRKRLLAVMQDITRRKRAEQALRESEARFRQFGEASSDALWIRNAETLRWEYLNPAFGAIYGVDTAEALESDSLAFLLEVVVPEDREQTLAAIRRLRDGDAVYEYRIRRPSGGEVRWIRTTAFRIVDADGVVRLLGGITQDMTSERRAADRMEVLVAELQHRTRNLIGVVQAMASRILNASASLDAFEEAFFSRLDALARVNGLLSRLKGGDRVTFDELLKTELEGQGIEVANDADTGITLEGPSAIELPSAAVQTLAMAIHELITNATKHGALGRGEGRLRVAWALVEDGDTRLRIDWRETGVPVPEEQRNASPEGYGRELIERALPYQLGAQTSYTLEPDGLRCTISLPLGTAAERRPDA